MRAGHTLKHVSAIFDQEEVVSITEGAKPPDVTGKSKVVDRQDSPHVAPDFRFKIRPVWCAISPHGVKADFGAEVLDWFNSRRANKSGDQDHLPRLKPQRTQAVKDGVARPEEMEAGSLVGFP